MKKYLAPIALALAVIIGAASIQAAGTWTAPSVAAPGGNVDAPVNVGLNSQSKLGQLLVNTDISNPFTVGMEVWGKTILDGGLQIKSSSPIQAGSVLTSDTNGNVTWQPAQTGGQAALGSMSLLDPNGNPTNILGFGQGGGSGNPCSGNGLLKIDAAGNKLVLSCDSGQVWPVGTIVLPSGVTASGSATIAPGSITLGVGNSSFTGQGDSLLLTTYYSTRYANSYSSSKINFTGARIDGYIPFTGNLQSYNITVHGSSIILGITGTDPSYNSVPIPVGILNLH